MKQKNTVVTLALLGVLALAAISGGLLPSDNVVYAVAPGFDNNTNTRSVPENTPPGVNIGDPSRPPTPTRTISSLATR